MTRIAFALALIACVLLLILGNLAIFSVIDQLSEKAASRRIEAAFSVRLEGVQFQCYPVRRVK